MVLWGKVLIVDDSKVYRQLMQMLLTPYCDTVLTAHSGREGIEQLERHAGIELVLCDYVMEGGDGFEVLEAISAMPEPRPPVIMVTAFRSQETEQRARALGAVDYLTKPTSMRRIIASLRDASFGDRRQINPRWRCSGKAHLLDEGEGHVVWDVYNISADGAFLETKGPVPVGGEIDLLLHLHGCKVEVRARVVRVQEPSWMNVGGAGIEFIGISREAEDAILAVIEFAVPE